MAIAEGWTLENTPTWAVGTVTMVFVSVSLVFVVAVDKLERLLKRNHRKPLVNALQKLKEEIFLMGFLSLLLAVFQNYVSSICVRTSVLTKWRPCKSETLAESGGSANVTEGGKRRLLATDSWPMIDWLHDPLFHGRILSQRTPKACDIGDSPLISKETLEELHTFIFILATVHITYSLFAMLLASTKVKRWKVWEEEARRDTNENLLEVVRSLSLHRQTTFIKYHTFRVFNRNQIFTWMVCFFRQFGKSVVRADYLALRLGFIKTHNIGQTFDFHGYILRSLEDEYQEVVGISASLWLFVIIFMLINAAGTNLFFWLSLIPAVLVLVVGAKLQHVIATLALESAGLTSSSTYSGPTVKLRDDLFWFKSPQLMLCLIHYIFFQNAFDMATFISYTWQFGLNSCLLDDKIYVYARLAIGVVVQIVCSYSTLPLYAFVTQMGSHYKKAIFREHVKEKLRHWKTGAAKRIKHGIPAGDSSQDGSSHGSESRQSTDLGSPDELELETIHEGGNDDQFEVPQEWETITESHASPMGPEFSTLEIINENDANPLLVRQAQPPSYTRAQSVPRVPPPQVTPRYHKQLSTDPGGARGVHFHLDSP